jgi:hypothetical protein
MAKGAATTTAMAMTSSGSKVKVPGRMIASKYSTENTSITTFDALIEGLAKAHLDI